MDLHFSGIHHVSFDFWLTLFKSNPEFKQKRDELLRDFFSIEHPVEQVSDTIRAYDRKFTLINERIGKNIDAHEMLLVILDELGADIHQLQLSSLNHYYSEMEQLFFKYHPVFIEANLPGWLQQLRQRNISLSILSNTGFVRGHSLRQLLQNLGISDLFGFQIYSDEVGLSKPSGAMFGLVSQHIGPERNLALQQVLHIGDNPNADFKGASDFGYMAALINSNGRSLNHISFS